MTTSNGHAGKGGTVPHVCVIGAGVCGLVSVKACLEAGLRVTCFDKSSQYGGLWQYRPDPRGESAPFEASVMKTTILNTSKELSAFSDFPPPAKLPNFMKHSLYMDYIRSYVDHFELAPHLRLEHEIVHCKPEWCCETGKLKWSVRVRDNRATVGHLVDYQSDGAAQEPGDKTSEGGGGGGGGKREFVQQFDRLMVAVGHHNVPYIPSFTGQHKFRGQIIHSARVKDILSDERFINKRVLVVGFGNSACDAANDMSMVADKCYVSCHRGNWFINRLTGEGLYDFKVKSRWYCHLSKWVPTPLSDRFFISKLEQRTNHQMLGLTPRHRPSEQVPAINDLFPYRILTGGVVLKGSISTFTENGVVFEGEREDEEHQVDIVVLATGYISRVPFLNEFELGLKSSELNEYELYLNMFAPRLTLASLSAAAGGGGGGEPDCGEPSPTPTPMEAIESLAFIGLVQPSGSITVVSELQARYAVQVFSGQLHLPSKKAMLKHIEKVRRGRARAIRSHSRDQLVGNWIGYLDLIAKQMRVKPNMAQLFYRDFALWRQLMFGPSVPYQYRLAGPNHWPQARETILTVDERVYQGINEGKNHILFQTRRKRLLDDSAKQQSKSN